MEVRLILSGPLTAASLHGSQEPESSMECVEWGGESTHDHIDQCTGVDRSWKWA
jgi:hypothetical protein